MDMVMGWSGILLVGVIRSSHDVGVYSAAWRTAFLLSWVLVSANTVAGPKIAALYARGEHAVVEGLARKTARAGTFAVLPVFVALVTFARPVLGIFGAGFGAGATALVIMAVGQLANVMTGPVGYLLMMTGNERLMRNIMIGAASLNVALQLALIPPIGIEGAAIATAVSLAALNLVTAAFAYRQLHVVAWPFRVRAASPSK
jgi:O-antigen/teichoic acid export membrane protein